MSFTNAPEELAKLQLLLAKEMNRWAIKDAVEQGVGLLGELIKAELAARRAQDFLERREIFRESEDEEEQER